MLVEIESEKAIPGEMMEQMRMTLEFIEEFKSKEYLQTFEIEDLEYDLALIPALRRVAKHYSVHTDFPMIDELQVVVDFGDFEDL